MLTLMVENQTMQEPFLAIAVPTTVDGVAVAESEELAKASSISCRRSSDDVPLRWADQM
jgi:hypothetical protein